MKTDRRNVLAGALALAGGSVAGASLAEDKPPPSAGRRPLLDPELELQIRQEIAARQAEKCLNRYESLLSSGDVEGALDEFALSRPDVQADVGFGFYYGPESVRRLIVGLHGWLELDPGTHRLKNGALYLLANTTPVIEVAADLKTAKGHWLCPAISTPGSAEHGFRSMSGYAFRVADFCIEDGRWKLWHYFVHGLLYHPEGKGWTEPESYAEITRGQSLDWMPEAFRPDASSGPGIGQAAIWRPDRPPTTVRIPEPYHTFTQTFTYARK